MDEKKIKKICDVLSSETRLKIIKLFTNKKHSAVEAYRKYNETYPDNKQRETIYRELEKLVEADILKKSYNQNKKSLEYKLNLSAISINMRGLKIETKVI